MAANVPPQLKPAGITPFVVRAVQLESAKPVIAYWCMMSHIYIILGDKPVDIC